MMGFLMFLALVWGALQAMETPTSAPTSQPATAEVTTLESVEPLRNYFNDHRDRLRFMALLSPT